MPERHHDTKGNSQPLQANQGVPDFRQCDLVSGSLSNPSQPSPSLLLRNHEILYVAQRAVVFKEPTPYPQQTYPRICEELPTAAQHRVIKLM